MTTYENKSEVVRLLQQIDEAYEAAHTALYGLAAGIARHDFIQAKLDHLEQHHEQLVDLINSEKQ
jgi:hypothetical protein